jgi:hypothetical protein
MAPTKKLFAEKKKAAPAKAMEKPASMIEKGAHDKQEYVEAMLLAARDGALALMAAGAEPKVNSQTLRNLLGRRASSELFMKKKSETKGLEGKSKKELDALLEGQFSKIARLMEKGKLVGINTD